MNNTFKNINNDHPLGIAMSVAVPLWILSIREKGGLSNQDFIEARETSILLGEKGDILLFGSSKKKGEAANIFNKTAKAIAVLSFCPGGITIFGQTFEANKILNVFRKRRTKIILD